MLYVFMSLRSLGFGVLEFNFLQPVALIPKLGVEFKPYCREFSRSHVVCIKFK